MSKRSNLGRCVYASIERMSKKVNVVQHFQIENIPPSNIQLSPGINPWTFRLTDVWR